MRNWRAKLTPTQRRIYDRSAAISAVPFSPTPQVFDVATALAETLPTEDLLRVQRRFWRNALRKNREHGEKKSHAETQRRRVEIFSAPLGLRVR